MICGPTAAGKSAVALELCETHDAVIVSADSRQIYRHFDIGTAKPTREERARVTHYGIDVADPRERYSAARWAGEANEWIECADKTGKEAAIVGGTGLYIKALVDPLFSAPKVDPLQRAELERELDAKPLVELRRWCERLDPAAIARDRDGPPRRLAHQRASLGAQSGDGGRRSARKNRVSGCGSWLQARIGNSDTSR